VTAGLTLLLACVITIIHHTGAYMRVPVLPLYAAAHGATPAVVGQIVALHTGIAALLAVPSGLASDRFGRTRLLALGAVMGAVATLSLAISSALWEIALAYALAGVGLALFSPSAVSISGDTARPTGVASAYGWVSMAIHAGSGLGPILGGAVGEHASVRTAFMVGGVLIVVALALTAVLASRLPRLRRTYRGALGAVAGNRVVQASWLMTVAGVGALGTVLAFFPLLARSRGLGLAATGTVLGAMALANMAARVPAGWILDRSRLRRPCTLAGVILASAATGVLPLAGDLTQLVLVAVVIGCALAISLVGAATMIIEATPAATRGAAMGGYITSQLAGQALAGLALGPVISRWGFPGAFALAGVCTASLALAAVALPRGEGA